MFRVRSLHFGLRRALHSGRPAQAAYYEDNNPHVWGSREEGTVLIHNPLYNKGTSFSMSERERMGLRGLVPPRVSDLETQVRRVMESLRKCPDDIVKYLSIMSLMDRNETLFYRVVTDYITELAPIIYTPTVGEACKQFSALYRRARGMYVCSRDRGEMHAMVYNWPSNVVDVIVVTDGSRILGLGDLGAQGMGIPIGKLALYVAVGGVMPGHVLPVQLDFGTDNQDLLNDPLYIGLPQPRIKGAEYMALMDEFMSAVTARWPNVFVQFEDFSTAKALSLLRRYRDRYLCFNDDIQGTGAVALAGLMSALRVRGLGPEAIREQRIVCVGAGSAGVGVLTSICSGMCREGLSSEEAQQRFWLVDDQGLVTAGRATDAQKPFARSDLADGLSLLEVINKAKPTVLLGLSGCAGAFTEEAVRAMTKYCDTPFICPMSNPTANAECTAEQAVQWSDGKAIIATGSPFAPVEFQGHTYCASQANNMYIFPSLGLMTVLARPQHVTDSMLYVAACALARALSAEDLQARRVYPDIARICDVSRIITAAVCEHAWDNGLATAPRPTDISATVDEAFYRAEYQPLVKLR